MPFNVLIADDHTIVRVGLRKILETQSDIVVTGEAADGREAIALSQELPCDVIIMDIAMPGLSGIDALQTILKLSPQIRIIILSMHDDSEYVYRAFQAGASGYLLKGVAGDEIITALREVMKGEIYIGKGLERSAFTDQPSVENPLIHLSMREKEVLKLVVEGKSSLEIAGLLSLADNTPDVYRSRIMKKLGLKNTASLVKFALQHGITSME
jgi:DNA-binding NarL/FixJ family response regulator